MSAINIEVTKNVYDVDLQQEVTTYDVTLEKGYYPLPSNIDLSNYYTKNETDLLLENYYLKTETYSQDEVDSLFSNETLDTVTERGNTTSNEITVGGLTTNYIQLDTTSVNTYNIGKIYWNETKGTYNFGLKNNVELQLGQEQHVYGKAYSAITNGQLVMYRTSQGGHILFEPANFTQLSTNPDLIIGVATQDIALNEFGYITTFGEVNTLNTSSFADGNTLYFGSGNVLQNTIPSGSYFIVGRVNRSHATQGIIFVKPYFVDSNLESKSNKSDSYTVSSSTTYASTKALVDGLATKFNTPSLGANTFPYWHVSGQFFNSNMSYINGNIVINLPGAATEKLDVGGRTKSDGIVINETSSAILPREMKFKSGNFVAAGNDGVEKKILREGDALTLPSAFKYGYGNNNVTSNNVFGIDALNSNTTGSNNAAFGRSLVSNTTGSRNSAFGSYASLFYNTIGNDNSSFGYSSLLLNVSGSQNSAFGVQSLENNTASNNSAFGYFSLKANTSGNNNCAFGNIALNINTTGSRNCAFGYETLNNNTTASFNTAFGSGASSLLSTGEKNVAIGAFAGTYSPSLSNINSYSNSVYIGEFSRPSANGVTNEIAIGKDSKGQGSNTATIGNENTDTFHLLKNGAGIVLKSPDGTKKVKISIDNSGNLITTLL